MFYKLSSPVCRVAHVRRGLGRRAFIKTSGRLSHRLTVTYGADRGLIAESEPASRRQELADVHVSRGWEQDVTSL